MAKKVVKDVSSAMEELVPFYAFYDGEKYKDDIYVSWNGRRYQIKRGQEVMIPRGVYLILERSAKQDMYRHKLINEQERAYAAETKALGY